MQQESAKSPMSLHGYTRPLAIPLESPLPAHIDPEENDGGFPEKARWVWCREGEPRAYNAWAWFRCQFTWNGALPIDLRLSADSRYRLWVNDRWAGEGPVRGWPDAWYHDCRRLNEALRPGENIILVLVQHYGCNTFHTIPQQGGFIAELISGGAVLAATGAQGWEASAAPEFRSASPRIAVQLPAMEIYDARLAESAAWEQPRLVDRPSWRGLRHRDVADAAVSAHPVAGQPQALLVRRRAPIWSVPALRILHPSTRLVAVQMTRAFALAAELDCARTTGPGEWMLRGWDLWIDGQKQDSGAPPVLHPGRHRVLLVVRDLFSDWVDIAVGFPQGEGVTWRDPETTNTVNPWRLLRNPDGNIAGDDLLWLTHNTHDLAEARKSWSGTGARWGSLTADAAGFAGLCRESGEIKPDTELFYEDPDALFKERVPLAEIELPAHPKGGWLIPPSGGDDVELAWDLGGQICGYHELELDAPAGAIIDLSLIEYIRPDGVLQHTDRNRNCFRYLTRAGRQRYTTRQRRSGRHLFLTVRNATAPVHLRALVVRESRYPAEALVPFSCSDEALSAIWRAAHRTMQLCIDDVFVDCPLYEQTLWVGDARNLQAYALTAYGARDVSRRCLRLAADSLRRLPMVGSQVPSGWDTIIPVWSFLWGIGVWEYYDYSGEHDALEEFWPAVMKNLRGAAAQLNRDMLFDAPWWNLFEWADLDCDHRVVIYNTLFFIGAVDAAIKCGRVLEAHDDLPWLETLARRLRAGAARRFDSERGLFPDAVQADGQSVWTRTGVHAQFLATLFDVATGDRARHLLARLEHNAGELVEMASPFAFQFWAEAFEKAGREDLVIRGLRERFAPMVEIGDTLWEALPGSKTSPLGYPTRSHCHGWSCCPMDFFPRILLGLRQTTPGGRSFACSPQPHGLTWAKGGRMTPFGPVKVEWRIEDGTCLVTIQAPPEVEVTLEPNQALQPLNLILVRKNPA
jgi:alpha-L-rhamnosidase